MKKIKLFSILCSLFSILLTACKNKELEAFNNLEKDRFLVKVEHTQARNIEDYLILVGSVKALDEAVLYPRISGKLLRNLATEANGWRRTRAWPL